MSKEERRELENADKLSEKGRWDEAIAKLEVLETSADREIHDLALNYLADAYESKDRHGDAEAMLRRSIAERGDANEGLGWQLAVLAPVVRRQGRNEEAEELYGRALAIFRADDSELKAITMRNLAYLYWSTGREERARELLAQLPQSDEGFLQFLDGVMKPYIEPETPL
jgi:tetratricopeptide (TPR) repeat protein